MHLATLKLVVTCSNTTLTTSNLAQPWPQLLPRRWALAAPPWRDRHGTGRVVDGDPFAADLLGLSTPDLEALGHARGGDPGADVTRARDGQCRR